MGGAIYYPKANRTAQWFGGGVDMGGVTKLLWHTTETAGGWPAYGGGDSAPQLTYEPWQHKWRQHIRLSHSARALRDPSGTVVRENRDKIVQVEISCYCDPKLYNAHGHAVTRLDAQAIDDLGEFGAFMYAEWGTPLELAPEWREYPRSAWADSPIRMSGPEFDAFTGWLGHQHASGNTHGDPGALAVHAILAAAKGGTTEKDWFDMSTPQDLDNSVNKPWMETSSTLNSDGTRSEKTVRQLLVLAADRSLKAARDSAISLAEVRAMQRGDVLDDAARAEIAAKVDQVLANQEAAVEEEV